MPNFASDGPCRPAETLVGTAVGRHLLARRKPGVQIPSPPPPTPQVKASPASSRRRSLPCCGRKLTSSSAEKALRDEATRPQASHTDHTAWSPPAADRRAILAHPIQPLPVDHAVEAATAQPPLTTTTKSKLTRRSPSTACTSLKRHTPTSGRRAVVDTAADHAPRPSQPHDCLPHCHAPRPHCGRTQRTLEGMDTRRPPRTPEAGHWTPGRSDTRTGHRTPISWAATRGTLDARTGHRRDKATTAQPASGPPGPPRRATAYWDAQLGRAVPVNHSQTAEVAGLVGNRQTLHWLG